MVLPTLPYLDGGGGAAGEGCVENHDGFPGEGGVGEDEAPPAGTNTVLEVAPVA